MCGLYGLAYGGTESYAPSVVHLLSILALLNESRGTHSTGMALVNGSNTRVYKQAVRASDYLTGKTGRAAMRAITNKIEQREPFIIIGHTRFGTVGEHTTRNAHPFYNSRKGKKPMVIGAHNGSIYPWRTIAEKYGLGDDIEVDSEVIFRGLQTITPEIWIGGLSKVGSIATTFVRDDRAKVNFFRGEHSEISLRLVSKLGVLCWSSESLHLKKATIGYEGMQFGIHHSRIYTVDLAALPPHLEAKKLEDLDSLLPFQETSDVPVLSEEEEKEGRRLQLEAKQRRDMERRMPTTDESEYAEIRDVRCMNPEKAKTFSKKGWGLIYDDRINDWLYTADVLVKTGDVVTVMPIYKRYQYGSAYITKKDCCGNNYGWYGSGRNYSSGDPWDEVEEVSARSRAQTPKKKAKKYNGPTLKQIKHMHDTSVDPNRKAICCSCDEEELVWNMLWFADMPYCYECYMEIFAAWELDQ